MCVCVCVCVCECRCEGGCVVLVMSFSTSYLSYQDVWLQYGAPFSLL